MPACFALALALAAAPARGENGADEPTFSRDVAPIVFARCVMCHRPEGSGPFPLTTCAEVASHARQIVEVTRKRSMPPWLAIEGFGDFADSRRLRDEEIETLARWVDAGRPEGDPAALPPAPTFHEGWQLGAPDLVVTMDAPYTVAAEGRDEVRNFVMPVDVGAPRWVDAIEIRFDNRRVVHHAALGMDDTGGCRRLDAKDETAGFPGMSMVPARHAGGHFVGWTPGKLPRRFADGTAWRLTPGVDLVLQLHMVPTGKPESVRATVGLYFTKTPATRPVYALTLRTDQIDIAPGVRDYVVEESFTLPVAAEAVAISPHAHYLGREMRIVATLPDGGVIPLIRIDDWNFDWQDTYVYATPVRIPAGSTLSMHYVFDNSDANPRNPNRPPARVTLGNQSTDEMATFMLELLLASDADHRALREAFERRELARHPQDFDARYNLAIALAERGEADAAIAEYREVIRLDPRHVLARTNLANLLKKRGLVAEAKALQEEALAIDPSSAQTLNNLGTLLCESGDDAGGMARLLEAARINPHLLEVQLNLAIAHERAGRWDAAYAAYESAHRIDPTHGFAVDGLARGCIRRGQLEKAERFAREGVALAPGEAEAHRRLASILAQRNRFADAAKEWLAVVERAPDDGVARRELARCHERGGQIDDAIAAYQDALRLAPEDFLALTGLARALASHPDPARRSPDVAVRLAERAARIEKADPLQVADTLSIAYAAAGRLAEATAQVEAALALLQGKEGPRFAAMRATLEERRNRLRDSAKPGEKPQR